MVDSLMIVSGKIRFWTTSLGQSMNKCIDDLLPHLLPTSTPTPTHSVYLRAQPENEVYLCAPQPGFVWFFVTGFKNYKSSLMIFVHVF